MWLTLLSQAGVALGLAISTKEQFPAWGARFETLVISVVVINQILGPVLCKIGMMRMEGRNSSSSNFKLELNEKNMRRRRRNKQEEAGRFLRSNTVDDLDTLVDVEDAVDDDETRRLVRCN